MRGIRPGERLFGFDVQRIVETLSRVTERPSLHYRALLIQGQDPNAAALADGRVYVTTGMLNYLASRGSRESELAFVLAHELAHTVAQHLVKRYRQLQQQQLMLALVNLGAAVAAREGGAKGEGFGGMARDVASLVNDVAESGYSQEQELEADQLGIRYCIRAGDSPWAAVNLLSDFTRFETPGPFLRTHPYTQLRAQYLERYLTEAGIPQSPPPPSQSSVVAPHPIAASKPVTPPMAEPRKRLLEAQTLYPKGSQSWKNIQRQLNQLDRSQADRRTH